MTEYVIDIRNLVKDIGSEIIISDEQIDETGKTVTEPVLVFASGGERIGYIPIVDLQKWIIHHIYAPEIKVLQKPRQFPATY
ncbi:Uncharacterised protein [uncultured archaeon]|nr:Uncharacterised protein [uncultured archaeon]